MSNHSVIEHRANYHYIKLEEDYIQICSQGKEYPHCKAFILSILEHWMNDKASKGQGAYVYMTYPQWRDAMYGLFRRNHIINALAELVQEGLILKRPCRLSGKDTYEYSLNVPIVQERLKVLEDKSEKYTRPKINPFKFKRVEKQTGLNLNASTRPNLNPSTHDDPFKFGHNIDSITELPEDIDTEEESTGEQEGTSAIASSLSLDAALSQSESETHSQQQQEIDLDFCNAETEHRLPAVTKPAPPARPASPDENRDAPRGSVAVTGPGATPSVPIPLALPGSPPPDALISVLIVAQQFTSVEQWKTAQDGFIETLRGVWKHAKPDYKRKYGNFNVYRKQHLDRWLAINFDPSIARFTADGKLLFDEWCSLFKAKVDAGKANIEAANWLAERLPPWVDVLNTTRVDLLRDFKGWCYTNDKKGYYTRGVKLFDLRREFEGWQSYQQSLLDKAERERARPQNKYGTVSGLPRLEPSQEWLEAMGGR